MKTGSIFQINDTSGTLSLADRTSEPSTSSYTINLLTSFAGETATSLSHSLTITIRDFLTSATSHTSVDSPLTVEFPVDQRPGILSNFTPPLPLGSYLVGDTFERLAVRSRRLFLLRRPYAAASYSVNLRAANGRNLAEIRVVIRSVFVARFSLAALTVRTLEGAQVGRLLFDSKRYLVDCRSCLFTVTGTSTVAVDLKSGVVTCVGPFVYGVNLEFTVRARSAGLSCVSW